MQGLDLPKVTDWLVANVADVEAPFDAELIAGGPVSYTHLTLPTNREV